MAEEYDNRFEEITGLLQETLKRVDRTQGGVDELRMEVRDLRTELSKNTSRLGTLENKFDIGVMAKEDHKRIDSLEKRVDNLESGVH
jgi:polyhydroxyalkanoate synthesis regulator phasin